MIKVIKMSNGEVSRTAIGIEKGIIDKLEQNEQLSNDDLFIVEVAFLLNGKVEILEAYMLFYQTKERLDLQEKYIFDMDSNIDLGLEALASSIKVEKIENYKYFENIEETWKAFSNIKSVP